MSQEEHLAENRKAAISRAIVAGYRRIPAGTPDEWGDPERFTDGGARETLERLAAEERRPGADPW